MTTIRILSAALLALGLAAAPALAKDRHCPPGLAKKTPACVPPGLAKKQGDWRGDDHDHDHAHDDHDHDHDDDVTDRRDRWRDYPYDRWIVLEEGDRVIFEGREYVVVDTDNGTVLRRGDDWYRLPRTRDGSDYVRVGDQILRVNRETREVIDMIRLADLILG